MKRSFRTGGGLAAVALAAAVRAAPAPSPLSAPVTFGPPLAAVLSTERRYTDAEGVSHVDTWRDRLVRRPDHLWLKRLGSTAPAAGNTDAHGHDHAMPSSAHAATDLVLVGNKPQLRYADARYLTSIPPEEWASTGFTADPFALASNVGPGLLARLPVSRRASPVAGARWHEGVANGVAWRVLWSPAQRFAWRVEARAPGGEVTTVSAAPATPDTPWVGYGRLAQRDYSDLLD